MTSTTKILFLLFSILLGCAKSNPTSTLPSANLSQISEITPESLQEVNLPSRPSAPENARMFELQLNVPAPFAGLLLSNDAAAFIVTEYQGLEQRYQLSLETQRRMDYARLTRDTQELQLQINTDRQRFQIVLESRDRYIDNLETIINNNNSFWSDFWKISGATGIGIIIGISIGFVAATTN